MVRRNENARFMPGAWVFPGGAVDPGDGDPSAGTAAYRDCARRELAEEAGVVLPSDTELVLFARWITPEVMPIRFDAWFFLALSPPDAKPAPDGSETTDVRWVSPSAALEATRRQEMEIFFPTVRKLEQLERFDSVEAVLAAHRDRAAEAVLPVVVASDDGVQIRVPGDADYPLTGNDANPACHGPAS